MHIVDELTYDMLDNVHPPFAEVCPENVIEKLSRFYDREEIISCYEEVKELHKENILFSEDDYEKFANVSVKTPMTLRKPLTRLTASFMITRLRGKEETRIKSPKLNNGCTHYPLHWYRHHLNIHFHSVP